MTIAGSALLAVAAAVAAAAGVRAAPRQATMRVTIGGGAAASPPVPPNFVGFSLESYSVRKAMVPPYARLLSHLHGATHGSHAGPVIRIGGDSADQSCWAPRPPGSTADETQCARNISSADLLAYRAFAEAAGPSANISFVIDTNLKQGDASVGAAHIRGIGAAGLWPHVSGIEIGNEVDHWNPGQLSLGAYVVAETANRLSSNSAAREASLRTERWSREASPRTAGRSIAHGSGTRRASRTSPRRTSEPACHPGCCRARCSAASTRRSSSDSARTPRAPRSVTTVDPG